MHTVKELDLRGLQVIDGGLATELELRGCDLSGPLWSGHVLSSSPETIAAVHRGYLEAGADCLITASYQVSFEGFRRAGLGDEDAAAALRRSVEVAESARRAYQASVQRRIWIAASLGAYGASLHNGAEFHGNYTCTFDEMVSFHSRRIAVLKETDADFLAFETIPSLEEARAILTALHQHSDVPATVTFTCRDEAHVGHGERLRDCASLLHPDPQIVGLGVNCTAPRFISSLLRELAGLRGKPVIVYPNSGEAWDGEGRRWLGARDPEAFCALARTWRGLGADWIGGCCRTGPEHIRAIVEGLRGQSACA